MEDLATVSTPPRKKKRAHPARKIVRRGQMHVAWVVAALGLAGLILVLGIVFFLTKA